MPFEWAAHQEAYSFALIDLPVTQGQRSKNRKTAQTSPIVLE